MDIGQNGFGRIRKISLVLLEAKKVINKTMGNQP